MYFDPGAAGLLLTVLASVLSVVVVVGFFFRPVREFFCLIGRKILGREKSSD